MLLEDINVIFLSENYYIFYFFFNNLGIQLNELDFFNIFQPHIQGVRIIEEALH